jgi:nickel-dependent lactate racemase
MQIPYGHTHFDLDIAADLLLPSPGTNGPSLEEMFVHADNRTYISNLQAARRVTLVVPDNTRPDAHRRVLPHLMPLMGGKAQVTIVVACGAHVAPGKSFLDELSALAPGADVHVHDCDSSRMVNLGVTRRGTPVRVNETLLSAEVLVGIGSVAVHPFAGLSGGPKHFVPGCAARETITANHSLLLDEKAAPGRLIDNPLYLDLLEAVSLLGEPLIINEALAPDGTPIGYHMGRVAQAHGLAAELALRAAAVPLDEPYDLIIASAGGLPRDINLYQAIKALEMAALACRPGGRLVLLAQCPEGVGSALYEDWALRGRSEQEEMVRSHFMVGAHKAFLATRALGKLGGAVLVSELPPSLVKSMGFMPATSLEEALSMTQITSASKIGVMPYATASLPRGLR